jgi:toxin YhaV
MASKATLVTWQLFYFKLFKTALDELEQTVTELSQQHPTTYKSHPKTRLLASVYKSITQLVPANPDHPDFRLGKTLGSEYANWRRVKKGMPDRYRLFFRFASSPVKLIVYVWFNGHGEDATHEYAARHVRSPRPNHLPQAGEGANESLRKLYYYDEDTLRKASSKTDVYEVFKRMLMRGEVPSSINALLDESREASS